VAHFGTRSPNKLVDYLKLFEMRLDSPQNSLKMIDLDNLTVKDVKLLNDIEKQIKNDFNELVKRIYHATDGNLAWLVNSLLSRNNFLSSVYLDLCYIDLVKKVSETETVNRVIVQTPVQRKVLNKYFKDAEMGHIKVTCAQKRKSRLKARLRPLYDFLQNIRFSIRWFALKDRKRRANVSKDRYITLIDTFFLSSMFKGDLYADRYYPGLNEMLSEKERADIYFVPTLLIKKGLRSILRISQNASENFLFKHDYLKASDYLRAILNPFFIKRINLKR